MVLKCSSNTCQTKNGVKIKSENAGSKLTRIVVVSYKFKVMTGCKWTDNYQSAAIRSQFHLSGFIQESCCCLLCMFHSMEKDDNFPIYIEKIDHYVDYILIFLLKKFTKDY